MMCEESQVRAIRLAERIHDLKSRHPLMRQAWARVASVPASEILRDTTDAKVREWSEDEKLAIIAAAHDAYHEPAIIECPSPTLVRFEKKEIQWPTVAEMNHAVLCDLVKRASPLMWDRIERWAQALVEAPPVPARRGSEADVEPESEPVGTQWSPPEPLSQLERAAWNVLVEQPEGKGLRGWELVDEMKKTYRLRTSESNLRSAIIPSLKRWGVRNKNGYYVDRQHPAYVWHIRLAKESTNSGQTANG